MGEVKWSLVCPVKDEIHLLARTLPSFYKVEPHEIIICLDKPAPSKVVKVIRKIAEEHNALEKTRILEVERNPEYNFHQAWVRRKGFLEAKYNRILTADVDLILNKNVLKAVRLVGRDNIGLVSLSKFRFPNGLAGLWRCIGYNFLRKAYAWIRYLRGGLSMTCFTGLYAIWRPYWLDSEDEGIKKLVNPKQALRGEEPQSVDGVCLGEDTYLRNCMERLHRCIYLSDIGAICVTDYLEDHPHVQFEKGRYSATRNRNMIGALIHAIMYCHPFYLKGFIYEKRRIRNISLTQKITPKVSYSLEKAREYWRYAPTSIGIIKTSTEELLDKPGDFIKNFVWRSIEERDKKEGAEKYRHRILKWIRKENVKSMLDFGCGIGQDGVYFGKNAGVSVTFADIVESNVKLTARYSEIFGLNSKAIYITDPEKQNFDERYDLILANGVLHHTPKAKEIVQNLKRYLKPNGLFICMLYTPEHYKSTRAKNLHEYATLSEGMLPETAKGIVNPYSDYYDMEKAKNLFEEFELLDCFTTHKKKFGWYVWKNV